MAEKWSYKIKSAWQKEHFRKICAWQVSQYFDERTSWSSKFGTKPSFLVNWCYQVKFLTVVNV